MRGRFFAFIGPDSLNINPGPLRIGALPASTGSIRLSNAGSINFGRASDAVGMQVLGVDSSNILTIGNTGTISEVRFTAAASGVGFVWNTGGADVDYTMKASEADALLLNGATSIVTMGVYGVGAATFDASGNISSVSDGRLKDILRPFTPGLDAVLGLRPQVYRWRPESHMETEHEYAGLVAQDVAEHIGELGVGHDGHGHLSMADRAVTATLVNAIQELTARVAALES